MKLLTKAKADLSIGVVYLHVTQSNVAALRLYQSAGFHVAEGLLKAPWENRDGDMQRMECIL